MAELAKELDYACFYSILKINGDDGDLMLRDSTQAD